MIEVPQKLTAIAATPRIEVDTDKKLSYNPVYAKVSSHHSPNYPTITSLVVYYLILPLRNVPLAGLIGHLIVIGEC